MFTNLNPKLLAFIFLHLSTIMVFAGQTYKRDFTVGPGDNSNHSITISAAAGDVLIVTFTAKEGYEFTEDTNRTNPAGLNWTPAGPNSFQLTVPKELKPDSAHQTKFFGMIKKTSTGGPDNGKAPEPLPWSLEGEFKVLNEHERVSFDYERNPVATMIIKTNRANIYDEGKITWDPNYQTYGRFVGSIEGDGGPFMGFYRGTIYIGEKAGIPLKLEKSGITDCPDGDKTKVYQAFYGCNSKDGFGVEVAPDTITMQTYTAQPELDQLKAEEKSIIEELKTAKEVFEKLQLELTAAKTAADNAQKAFDKRVEEVLAGIEKVKEAREAVKRAESELEKKTAVRDAEQAEIDKIKAIPQQIDQLKKSIAQAGTAINQLEKEIETASSKERQILRKQIRELEKTIADLEDQLEKLVDTNQDKKLAKAIIKLNQAQDALDDAAAVLAKAKLDLEKIIADELAKFEKYPTYIKMKAELDALKAQVAKIEAKLTAAEAEVKIIEEKLRLIHEKIASLQKLLERWKESLVSLTAHEEEHRIIAYHYANKLNKLFNILNAWAYAPLQSRAETLAVKQFHQIIYDLGIQYRSELSDKQKRFDFLTEHGKFPKKWDRSEELKD